MSRSGYTEDSENDWALICWRGAVASAIRGKRGQAFLREMLAALDALPEKRLISEDLERADGQVCALGSVGKARNLDMSEMDPEDPDTVAGKFNISLALERSTRPSVSDAARARGLSRGPARFVPALSHRRVRELRVSARGDAFRGVRAQ